MKRLFATGLAVVAMMLVVTVGAMAAERSWGQLVGHGVVTQPFFGDIEIDVHLFFVGDRAEGDLTIATDDLIVTLDEGGPFADACPVSGIRGRGTVVFANGDPPIDVGISVGIGGGPRGSRNQVGARITASGIFFLQFDKVPDTGGFANPCPIAPR